MSEHSRRLRWWERRQRALDAGWWVLVAVGMAPITTAVARALGGA